jgi:lipopolysaccharide/colanic/teichoic acid biosynthesis glycosyltransferase
MKNAINYENIKTLEFKKTKLYKTHFCFYSVIKRILDILLALIILIIASPVMLITAIAVKLDSKGPAIFKQIRTGKNGKEFTMYKFRSMPIYNDVHDFSRKDELTKTGKFIRNTSIDEIPQLFNIIKGDMSFVGPRPWITDYYKRMNKKERVRYDVLPGITGLAQAKGRNNISIFTKINYDIEYVRDFSLFEDIKVILLTIKTVLTHEGASAGKGIIQKELNELDLENTRYDMEPIKKIIE